MNQCEQLDFVIHLFDNNRYSFDDDYVTNFDSNINNVWECFGGNKLTLIRDSKTNQLVQRWIAKSNNAYKKKYTKKLKIC